jgi:hypothetical protein
LGSHDARQRSGRGRADRDGVLVGVDGARASTQAHQRHRALYFIISPSKSAGRMGRIELSYGPDAQYFHIAKRNDLRDDADNRRGRRLQKHQLRQQPRILFRGNANENVSSDERDDNYVFIIISNNNSRFIIFDSNNNNSCVINNHDS